MTPAVARRRVVAGVALLAGLAGVAGAAPLPAAASPPPAPAVTLPTLRVAVKPLAPFVVAGRDGYQGFSIDLLDQIARRAGFTYTLEPMGSVDEQVSAVQGGRADLAIAGISVTSAREREVDFSVPMYHAGLQVLVASDGPRSAGVTTLAVLGTLLPTLLLVALLLLLVAHAIWLIESRENPDHFPRSYREGLLEGLWWASVTMTTVGYGDRTPRGVWGRLLGVVWMFAAILIIANLTASIASAFTVQSLQSSITGVNDLPGKRVATVAGTTSSTFLSGRGIDVVTSATVDDAYGLLRSRKVDAVVFDAPVLEYYAKTAGAGRTRVVGSVFDSQDYGIALPRGSPYLEAVNVALLQTEEDGTYERIRASWFGSPS